MTRVEPVPGERAAVAHLETETALVLSDIHTGIESELRSEGLEIESQAEERCRAIMRLIEETAVDRVIFLGDLAHWIGEPQKTERQEILTLIQAVTDKVPAVLIKGNHDGGIEATVSIPVSEPGGKRWGEVGFIHGNSWPDEDVLTGDILCVGHEHPVVRIEDEVGGARIEPVWIRGKVDPAPFDAVDGSEVADELVIFPAFNELVTGTWVNIEEQDFLSPFLPDALLSGEAYLLDGTRLGDYRVV